MKLSYQQTPLDNGLRVVTCAMPHAYSVGVGLHLAIGSRYESDELAGICHFLEHMLFKGTERRPSPPALAALIEGRGGVFNAVTAQESMTLWAKLPGVHLPLALDVLTDMLRHSLLLPAEIEKERRVILEELAATQDVPEELVGHWVYSITWPDHPLGRDVAGTPESVSRIARDDIAAFMAGYVTPQAAVLSVAGDVEHERVVEVAAAFLGGWPGGLAPSFVPAPPNGLDVRVAVVHRQTEQTHFVLHLPGIPRSDPDRYPLALLQTILGEGMSSRLFQEIRERLGLAYAVDSYTSLLSDTGVVGVYAAVAPENTGRTLQAVLSELRRLRDEPVSDEELVLAKEQSKGRLLLSMEDTLSVAGWFGRQAVLNHEILTVEEVAARLEAATAEDVQRVARRLFRPAGARLAVVGPHRSHEEAAFQEILLGGL